jgi:ankyrin repeat protein
MNSLRNRVFSRNWVTFLIVSSISQISQGGKKVLLFARAPGISTPVILLEKRYGFLGNTMWLEKVLDRFIARLPNSGSLIVAQDPSRIVRELLEGGDTFNDVGDRRNTDLMLAARNGHEQVVRKLTERGVNLEAKDKQRRTALELAAENGHGSIVNILLSAGASLDAWEVNGDIAAMVWRS